MQRDWRSTAGASFESHSWRVQTLDAGNPANFRLGCWELLRVREGNDFTAAWLDLGILKARRLRVALPPPAPLLVDRRAREGDAERQHFFCVRQWSRISSRCAGLVVGLT